MKINFIGQMLSLILMNTAGQDAQVSVIHCHIRYEHDNNVFNYVQSDMRVIPARTKCSIAAKNNHAQLNTSPCDPSGASVSSSV